jgi:hypothetical protein
MRAVPLCAALALAAAPARAQAPDSASWCVPAAPEDSAGLARWACAGAGYDAAVRFSVSLPAGWEVASPRDGGVMIWALHQGVQLSVAAEDPLHDPRTRMDTLGFWVRATRQWLGREPELGEVNDFERRARTPADARDAVTRAQLADAALLAMARGLSLAHDGEEVDDVRVEVRRLDGEPAGWLTETYQTAGAVWRVESYVTVRDAVVFIANLTAVEEEFDAALPVWARVLASLDMRTDRSGTGTP